MKNIIPFHQRLKAWRVFRGLTQQELAHHSKIPRPNLVAIEKGHRDCTLSTLDKLAASLKLSPGQLLDLLPADFIKLNRFEMDRLCRSFFEESASLPTKLEKLSWILLPSVAPTLKMLKLKKATTKNWAKGLPLSFFISRKVNQQMYKRFNKLAANFI